jgi:hypothetical protein
VHCFWADCKTGISALANIWNTSSWIKTPRIFTKKQAIVSTAEFVGIGENSWQASPRPVGSQKDGPLFSCSLRAILNAQLRRAFGKSFSFRELKATGIVLTDVKIHTHE